MATPPERNLVMPAEEAATIDPKVLASARCLYNPETKLLIRKYEEVMRSLDPTWEPHPLVKSAREYLERMYPVTNDKTVETVREILDKWRELHEYECALLVNLNPETADEAMALVPSLADGRYTTEDLEALLAELAPYLTSS